ncbi:MAG: Ras GTPase activating protein ira2 [Sclerophora amabilis]|nr:MAG: Ras GTPase activating protein ira2 [Sclerophora amabilis]
MNGAEKIVGILIDRLLARLPHRSGVPVNDLRHDEVVILTQNTLTQISKTALGVVFNGLVSVLGALSAGPHSDPESDNLIQSKTYVVELLADCCNEHWSTIKSAARENATLGGARNNSGSTDCSTSESPASSIDLQQDRKTIRVPSSDRLVHSVLPPSLEDAQATFALNVLTELVTPIPEDGQVPLTMLLETGPWALHSTRKNLAQPIKENRMNQVRPKELDLAAFEVMEYISAANWSLVFNFLQCNLRSLRATGQSAGASSYQSTEVSKDSDTTALRALQLLARLWVDGKKLSLIIHELCGCFLSLRKSAQNAIAVLFPGLIARWLQNNPAEFVGLHATESRLDSGADALFDMSNSMGDDPRRKMFLWPFQGSLLLLIPEVFWVAGDLRGSKNSHVAKKAAYLEGLKKSLHSSRNSSTAILCLIGFCKAAQYFPVDSDSALFSYVLDFQNDLREEVFKPAMAPESQREEIHLMIAAFVCLSSLNLQSMLDNLVPRCMRLDAPLHLKLALFGSCAIIACQPDAESYRPLFSAVLPVLREFLKGPSTTPSGSVGSGELMHPGARPDIFESEEFRYCMLQFLAARPSLVYEGLPSESRLNSQLLAQCLDHFINLLADDDKQVRQLADSVARSITSESVTSWLRGTEEIGAYEFLFQYWGATFIMLSTFAGKLLDPRVEEHGIKSLNNFIRDYMERRKLELSLEEGAEIVERVGASADLETALLVLLCSSDLRICSAVTTLLSVFYEEGRQAESSLHAALPSLSILRNFQAYSELASQDLRITGVVAFQKRFRKLLARMTTPTAGILTAWEKVFKRWNDLSVILLEASRGKPSLNERSMVEWRNYSGLLASLGGFCIANSPVAAQIEVSMIAGLRWIDRLSIDGSDVSLLDQFLIQNLQLLVCSNIRVREAIIEVLGTELNPMLYAQLFQALASQLTLVFGGSREEYSLPYRILVLEQVASLLRTIVDRLDDFDESFHSTDFGTLTLNLALAVHTIDLETAVWRVKIKICQLCEAVTSKRDTLRLKHDVQIRGQLFEVLVGWMSQPGNANKHTSASTTSVRPDDIFRLQRDLDRGCLRACVHLSSQLPLHPLEHQDDAESSDIQSQQFRSHFHRFFSLLSQESGGLDAGHRKFVHMTRAHRDDISQNSECAITILSNLLSANIDVGLKQVLEIGYHEDLESRAAFIKVLKNILNEGGGLERLSESTINERYIALLQLFVDDLDLTVALCDSCPSSEVDEIAVVLLNMFHSRGMGLLFLKALIEHEVSATENESELLRRNSVATKVLTVYAKWNGSEYLRSTLQQLLGVLFDTAGNLNLELDPTRVSSDQLERNALNLRDTTQVVVDSIVGSAEKTPLMFRRICHTIATAVTRRFPDAKFTAVGSFIFLRFFCPAIVAPESEGLVASTPTKEMRRGLLLIGKVVQNLANNVLFGAKEPYMSPLNDFLAHNIYQVTAFLRTIAAPLKRTDQEPTTEASDFGSSVVLHRFLYHHWDSVKRKILIHQRGLSDKSPPRFGLDLNSTEQHASISELEGILPTLGPPPSEISWTRPSIFKNSPPKYARFQQFMFKNATRNTELALATQAVYDGGHSLDQLPIMCFILRNCEIRSVDRDPILYCYLKTASRMWHKPFGILFDVTCHNTPLDLNDLLAKLEFLCPVEFQKNLSRIYIYNLNSSYRKSWRRVLRNITKNEQSIFNPANVQFLMVGSFPELQSHFDLGSLHLPKDTLSVVTDSRFTFQPVVRLSRTKGKVEVVIKTGNQFIQISTVKKQEVIPELRFSTTINDIFRIKDFEEASAKTQTDDDNAFGLRTENGKVIMFFTSPRKYEILQAIKTAKARYNRDSLPNKSSERHIRPEDIPGTLLNISLMNLASSNDGLRRTSYNLLCGLCKAFSFGLEKEFVSTKDLDFPAHSVKLVVNISSRLAQTEPQLTGDFLTEFFLAWDKSPSQQRTLNLLYMVPWLFNLRRHVLLPEIDGEKGREKVASFARKLVDLATQEPGLSTALQQHVWPVLAQDEVLVDVLLDDMVKIATTNDPENIRGDRVGSIAAGLGSTIVRGKLITRLRRILNRSSLRPTRHLSDNAVWDEICVLLRICLAVSFGSGSLPQLYLPELFHIITMVVNTGSAAMRLCVHKLLVNTVHAMCVSFPLEEVSLNKLRSCLASFSEPKAELLFTLHTISTGDGNLLPPHQGSASAGFSSTEAITELLLEIINVGAPSTSIANHWRARWMSLVASTAFQSNPAIQPRSFTVMGCLTRDDVDDDLLYQVLVALRTGVHRFAEDDDNELLVAIMVTLTKMMSKLSTSSRYILQLFWLAISLVRLVPPNIYTRAAAFFDAVLHILASSGDLKDGKMAPLLLRGRIPIEEATSKIDQLYGVRFIRENFHVACSACLLRGLTDSSTKAPAVRVLTSLLELASTSAPKSGKFPKDVAVLPYLGLVAARSTSIEDSREALRLAGANLPADFSSPADVFAMIDLDRIGERDLLLNAALSITDFRSCEDFVQQRTLTFLNRIAIQRPSVFLRLYNPLTSILDHVLSSSQTTLALKAGQSLAGTLAANEQFAKPPSATDPLDAILAEVGLSGIWTSSSFKASRDLQKTCGGHIEKLIEVCI